MEGWMEGWGRFVEGDVSRATCASRDVMPREKVVLLVGIALVGPPAPTNACDDISGWSAGCICSVFAIAAWRISESRTAGISLVFYRPYTPLPTSGGYRHQRLQHSGDCAVQTHLHKYKHTILHILTSGAPTHHS